MNKINAELYQRLETLIKAMNFELVGCELQPQGRQLVFRIYIDSPYGVSIEDCSTISHQVSALLDVEDPIQRRYSLEVSSPGIDRPLFTLEHYQKYVGRKIKLKLQLPINNRRQFKGKIERVQNNHIYLLVEGSDEAVQIPYDMIEKANVIGEIARKTND